MASKIIIKTCKYCGREFETDKNARKYCSRSCSSSVSRAWAAEYHAKREKNLNCAYCGKPFSNIRKKTYCSNECRLLADGKCSTKIISEKRKSTKPELSLAEVLVRAKAEKLSYGKYCAKYGIK